MSYTRNEVIVQVKDLCVSYDRPILRDVNFQITNVVRPDVQQGQVVSIIGRSGIGKSQLFRCLAGLQKPTSGEVRIGADLHLVHAGEVGVVPQNYVLLRHRTVKQNLELANAMAENRWALLEGPYAVLLEDFDILKLLKQYPHQISGGQRQRVSILQQIIAGNRTILLDEPFSGLDAPMIVKVLSLLQKVSLLHELQTLVIVSHDIESALAISDTAILLGAGHPTPDPQHEGRLLFKDGATIRHTYDLAAMGLAFREGIQEDPAFRKLVHDVKHNL